MASLPLPMNAPTLPASMSLLPGAMNVFDTGTRRLLAYSFLRVGSVEVTLSFLIKTAVFLALLVLFSRLLQSVVLARVLRRIHIPEAQKFALGRFVTYLFFLGGLFVGLQSMGLNLNSFVVFGGAIGVGVGLGLQNVVSNFVAGLILLIEQPIRIGDRIEVKDTLGDVIRIAARSTWVRTNDNVVIVVPNSEFINNATINWTANDQRVRVKLPVGVGYGSDPDQVRSLLLDVAFGTNGVLHEPAPSVIFMDFGDSSLDFSLWVWTEAHTHAPLVLRSELYFEIFRVFKEHQIELPFPQRDLHIRSDFRSPEMELPSDEHAALSQMARERPAAARGSRS